MTHEASKLDDVDRAMIDFERDWPVDMSIDRNKDAEILQRFGMTNVEYYLALVNLIHVPDALAYDEVTVRRLLRDAARDRSPSTRLADVVPMKRTKNKSQPPA